MEFWGFWSCWGVAGYVGVGDFVGVGGVGCLNNLRGCWGVLASWVWRRWSLGDVCVCGLCERWDVLTCRFWGRCGRCGLEDVEGSLGGCVSVGGFWGVCGWDFWGFNDVIALAVVGAL